MSDRKASPAFAGADGRYLDNVVWHSIDGRLSALAERNGLAARFHPEVSPFAAVCDDPPPEAWRDLSEIVGEGKAAVLLAPEVRTADGWVREHAIPCLQLVAGDIVDPQAEVDIVDLGPQDVPEMLDLVAATQPGPFGRRTIEFGGYIGHRVEGRLVAMAGERLRTPGFTEVSAVCTAEDQRGRGLAATLTLAVVRRIRRRGDEAFLHVATFNENAIRLYLALGFTLRTHAEAVVVRRQAGDR